MTALRALAATFDPAGVLNPGSLLDDDGPRPSETAAIATKRAQTSARAGAGR